MMRGARARVRARVARVARGGRGRRSPGRSTPTRSSARGSRRPPRCFPRRRAVDLPLADDSRAVFMREVADTHRELYAENADLYGANVASKIERCLEVTDSEYQAGLRARESYRAAFDERLGERRPRRHARRCPASRRPSGRRARAARLADAPHLAVQRARRAGAGDPVRRRPRTGSRHRSRSPAGRATTRSCSRPARRPGRPAQVVAPRCRQRGSTHVLAHLHPARVRLRGVRARSADRAAPSRSALRPHAQLCSPPRPACAHSSSAQTSRPSTAFSRTPSFAWSPYYGATSYDFQLATSKTFDDRTLVWSTDSRVDPAQGAGGDDPDRAPVDDRAPVRAVRPRPSGDPARDDPLERAVRVQHGGRQRPRASRPGHSRPRPLDAGRERDLLRGLVLVAKAVHSKIIRTTTNVADEREVLCASRILARPESCSGGSAPSGSSTAAGSERVADHVLRPLERRLLLGRPRRTRPSRCASWRSVSDTIATARRCARSQPHSWVRLDRHRLRRRLSG